MLEMCYSHFLLCISILSYSNRGVRTNHVLYDSFRGVQRLHIPPYSFIAQLGSEQFRKFTYPVIASAIKHSEVRQAEFQPRSLPLLSQLLRQRHGDADTLKSRQTGKVGLDVRRKAITHTSGRLSASVIVCERNWAGLASGSHSSSKRADGAALGFAISSRVTNGCSHKWENIDRNITSI